MKLSVLIIAILLPFFILILSLNLHIYNDKFYINEFEKNNVYDAIDKNNVLDNYRILMEYFKGKNNLDESFFNEKEKAHLLDVRQLITTTRSLFYLSLATLIFATSYLAYKRKFNELVAGMLTGSIIGILLLLLLFLIVSINFNFAFIAFHLGVFSNDLWLLNPEIDNLIIMFPQGFFYDSVAAILVTSMVIYIVIFLPSLWLFIRSSVKNKHLS